MGSGHLSVSRACLALTLTVVLLLGGGWVNPSDAGCGGCQNGGKLLLPNNIFGVCRCKCLKSFKGPFCQFSVKRSGGAGQGYEEFDGEEEEYPLVPAVPPVSLLEVLNKRFLARRPTPDELRRWLDGQ